jgi:hypothetical protein
MESGEGSQTKASLTTFSLESVSWLECGSMAASRLQLLQMPNACSAQSRDALIAEKRDHDRLSSVADLVPFVNHDTKTEYWQTL